MQKEREERLWVEDLRKAKERRRSKETELQKRINGRAILYPQS